MTDGDSKKNQSWIERLPKQTRKNIVVIVVIILTLIIFFFWLGLLSKELAPAAVDEKQTAGLTKAKTDFSTFLENTKQQLDVLKNQVKNLTSLAEESTKPELTAEMIAKIKDQLLAGELKDWQSYNNEKFQYQIKYPTNWRTDDSDPLITTITSSSTPELNSTVKIQVMAEKNLSFAADLIKNFPAGCAQKQETVINDSPAVQLRCLETINGVSYEKENYLIEKNNNLYILSFLKSEKNLNETLLKIITTFEFAPQLKP